jgi:hypothetical protein
MTWSWGHTAEAYTNARNNVFRKPREWLAVVFAEWRAAQNKHGVVTDHNSFNRRKYDRALVWASNPDNIDDESLADQIWTWMEEQADCDNGGWQAHSCPSGCPCHYVTFSRIGENRDPDAEVKLENGSYTLEIVTAQSAKWAEGKPGYDGDAFSGDEETIRETVKAMRQAEYEVNTPEGFDEHDYQGM